MVESDEGIKLLLEAFQMSVSACQAHPTVAMLHQQLQGRLQLVCKSSQVHIPPPLQHSPTPKPQDPSSFNFAGQLQGTPPPLPYPAI